MISLERIHRVDNETVSVICKDCLKEVQIKATRGQMKMWEDGMLIQNALPKASLART